MRLTRSNPAVKSGAVALVFVLALSASAWSQEVTMAMLHPGAIEPAAAVMPAQSVELPEAPREHKFWDGENRVLFATTAAFCAADFAVTRSNLQSGGRELNPVTRIFSGSTAGLTANFAGETAGVIGLSYFFHKSGHHRLERLTPLVNFGASAVAVTYGLTHR